MDVVFIVWNVSRMDAVIDLRNVMYMKKVSWMYVVNRM